MFSATQKHFAFGTSWLYLIQNAGNLVPFTFGITEGKRPLLRSTNTPQAISLLGIIALVKLTSRTPLTPRYPFALLPVSANPRRPLHTIFQISGFRPSLLLSPPSTPPHNTAMSALEEKSQAAGADASAADESEVRTSCMYTDEKRGRLNVRA